LGGLSTHPDIDGLGQLQVGEASPLSEGLHIPHRLFMVLFDLAISDLGLKLLEDRGHEFSRAGPVLLHKGALRHPWLNQYEIEA
jgi:hypothetical protein